MVKLSLKKETVTERNMNPKTTRAYYNHSKLPLQQAKTFSETFMKDEQARHVHRYTISVSLGLTN